MQSTSENIKKAITTGKDCKSYSPATTEEAINLYKTISSNNLNYNRRSNKQTILYWEEKNKLFKKLQRFSTLKKELSHSKNLKPKIETKLNYYSKKIQLCNEYETCNPTDIFSIKLFNEWLIKKYKNRLENYKLIDITDKTN